MRNFKITIAALVATILLTSCSDDFIKPSKNITTENRQVPAFTEIMAADFIKVYIKYSDSIQTVEVSANDNIQDKLITEVNNGQLAIKTKQGNLSINGDVTANVYITTTNITRYIAKDQASFNLNDMHEASSLIIDLDDQSEFIGDVKVNTLYAKTTDQASLKLFGSADDFDITSNDQSEAHCFTMEIKNLTVTVEDQATTEVNVINEIEATTRDQGALFYQGNPTTTRFSIHDQSRIVRR